MKLNYVSVKGYEETEDGLRLCIRAELEEPPPKIWSKLFQLTWHIAPASRTLPAELKLAKSDILLFIPAADRLSETIDALKSTVTAVNQKVRDMVHEESPYNLNKASIL